MENDKPKHPGGRPTEYNDEIAGLVCQGLAEGKSLRKVCEAEEMPDKATVFRWLTKHKEFCDQYEKAKIESAECKREDVEELGDEAIEAIHTVEDPKRAGALATAYKLKADNIKWIMARMKPKKYGDKLDVTSDGKVLPTPIISVNRDNLTNQ